MCSSFEYAEDTVAGKLLPDWGRDDTVAKTQVRGGLWEEGTHMLVLWKVNSLW